MIELILSGLSFIVNKKFYISMLDFSTQKTILDPILKNPKNHICADCDTISPTWASLDFGVFLCSNCSGAHRALGPTITRVRSANLDKWNSEWVNNMQLGNTQINSYWESNPQVIGRKPQMGANLDVIARYVFEKYVKKKFVMDPSVADPLTSYKNGTYQQNSKEQQTKAAYQDPKVQTTQNQTKSPTKPIRMETPTVKADVCLLQFDFQHKHTPVPSATSSNQTVNNQIAQPNYVNPKTIQTTTEEEDQFTDFAQAGSSWNQEEKIDSFISFDTLLTQQKQIQPQQPPQNSYNSYNPIKSPYNPMTGQHNLVYNSHYTNQQPHQYNQFNYQPQYSQHLHHHHHQMAQPGLSYGMGYHNQAGVSQTVNQYWK